MLKQPFIIIASNKHPADLYPKTFQYLKARFHVIDVGFSNPQHPGPILRVKEGLSELSESRLERQIKS